MNAPALFTPHSLSAIALVLACWVLPAGAQSPNPKPLSAKEPVSLNFQNVDIDAVARTLATMSGHNVVVDPRVKGTMTLSSTVPVPTGRGDQGQGQCRAVVVG